MKIDYTKIFKEMGLINHVDLNVNTNELFLKGATCSIYIVEIDTSLSIEEINSYFIDIFEEQNVICKSSHELEIRIDSFLGTYKATQNSNLYFLISPNKHIQLDKETPYFLTYLGTPRKVLENLNKFQRDFIIQLKNFKIEESPKVDYSEFLNVFAEKVASEYQKLNNFENKKNPKVWMIGNGLMLPDTLVGCNDLKEFEMVIYCNQIAIQWLLLSSNLKKIANVSDSDLNGLLTYIKEVYAYRGSIDLEKIRIGTLEEYEFRKDCNYFINELNDDEIQEIFEGIEYDICMLIKENGKYNFSSKSKVIDGYNTGGISDIKDIYDTLSKVTDMSHIEFIASIA